MSSVLHLLRHDVRRLAPWIALYFLALTWRVATLDAGAGRTGQGSYLVLHLGLVLLLGALVLEHPLFVRRAFWRTRPVAPRDLLAARGLFAVVLLWGPLILAQTLGLWLLGVDHPPLLALATVDGLFAMGFLIATLLALVSLCRRPYQVAIALFLSLVLPPFFLLFPPSGGAGREPVVPYLTAMAIVLLATSLLALRAIYLRRWQPLVPAVVLWVLAPFLPLPVLDSWADVPLSQGRTTAIAPLDPLRIDLAPSMVPRTFSDGRPWLQVELSPGNLPADRGLQLLGFSGHLTTPDGRQVPLKSYWLSALERSEGRFRCLLPPSVAESLPELDSHQTRIAGCRPELSLRLLPLEGAAGTRPRGKLELRLELRAIEARLTRQALRPGLTFRRGFELLEIRDFEGEAGGPIRLTTARIGPLGVSRSPYESFTSEFGPVRILDRSVGRFFSSDGPSDRRRHKLLESLTFFPRIEADLAVEGLEHTRGLPLQHSPPGADPDHPFDVVGLELSHSEPFEVTVTIDDFDAFDFLYPEEADPGQQDPRAR